MLTITVGPISREYRLYETTAPANAEHLVTPVMVAPPPATKRAKRPKKS